MDRMATSPKLDIFLMLKAALSGERAFPSAREVEGLSAASARALGVRFATPSRRRRSELGTKFTAVRILGAVSAGYGDPVEPTDLGSIPVNLEALNIKVSTRTFALKVRGDSMIGAQIADGDLVILEAREPKIGEIVAALIDGETTLKRFVASDGQMFLRAENPKYPDLIPLRDLTIQGVMRAVVRVCDVKVASR